MRASVAAIGSTKTAKLVGIGEGTVRAWVAGRGKPRPKACEAIRAALSTPSRETPPSRVAKGEAKPAGPFLEDADDPKANAVATLRKLRVALDDAAPEQIHRIANAVTSASRLLARLSGQLEVTEAQILRSAAWGRLVGVVRAVLEAYPGASTALDKAMADFEGGA